MLDIVLTCVVDWMCEYDNVAAFNSNIDAAWECCRVGRWDTSQGLLLCGINCV